MIDADLKQHASLYALQATDVTYPRVQQDITYDDVFNAIEAAYKAGFAAAHERSEIEK
jgi:hypothetical protein